MKWASTYQVLEQCLPQSKHSINIRDSHCFSFFAQEPCESWLPSLLPTITLWSFIAKWGGRQFAPQQKPWKTPVPTHPATSTHRNPSPAFNPFSSSFAGPKPRPPSTVRPVMPTSTTRTTAHLLLTCCHCPGISGPPVCTLGCPSPAQASSCC